MGTEKLRGIVLREQAKGESNKQIVLLAQGVGRVLLSARGARRAKSKLLAATQLFCYADFVVYEGKGFYSVTQAELKNSFYGLRLDMDKFSEGMYLAELTERSCPAGMEQDAVLELLYYAFQDSIFVLDAVRRAVRFVLERESRAAFGFQLSAEALEQLTFILRKYLEVHMGIRLKTRDFFEQ